MQRQGSFGEAEYAGKKKQTRRDKFLAEMNAVVPWSRLVACLAPLYPKGERGRPPIPLERMLRVYFVQQWYGLADEAVEDALYDSQALRGFAGIALTSSNSPLVKSCRSSQCRKCKTVVASGTGSRFNAIPAKPRNAWLS